MNRDEAIEETSKIKEQLGVFYKLPT